LATALGVTRQTAHNFLTGRTMPSYENCEKLGLIPAFVVRETEGTGEMSNLDEFLMQRERNHVPNGMTSETDLNAVLVSARGTSMMRDLVQATRTTAARVGSIDGIPLEWDDGQSGRSVSPLLKLGSVGAQFKNVMSISRRSLSGYRVVFGWVTTSTGEGRKNVPDRVWNLKLSCDAGVLAWNVNRDEIVDTSSIKLAEQLVMQLIDFRDEYQSAN
jgi:hypothetical protein